MARGDQQLEEIGRSTASSVAVGCLKELSSTTGS